MIEHRVAMHFLSHFA